MWETSSILTETLSKFISIWTKRAESLPEMQILTGTDTEFAMQIQNGGLLTCS